MPTASSDTNGRQNGVLKVAQVIGNAQGGVMSCVMNYYRAIDRSAVQFDFFTYGPSQYDDEIRALGGSVYHFPNVFYVAKSVPALKKLFKHNGYDVVHAHLTTRSVFALSAAKQAKVPVRICHAHSTSHRSEGLGYLAKSMLKPFCLAYATHLAGCSKLSNEWLFGKKRAKHAFLMRNAVNLERFNPYDRPRHSVKTVGFVGRFVFQKNVEFLLRCFEELLKLRTDVKLVLVGDGKQKEKLQNLARKCCGNKVEFRDETPRVEQAYKQFDVFVMTSRFEGLPLVAVEAQCCGTACVLSDKITKEADIGGNVKFLPLTDAKLWARIINQTLDEESVHAAPKQFGYDITVEAQRLLEYYQSVVKR